MPAVLRVATYNVHACVGTDRRHDPARTAQVIAELEADVVALQEFTYPAEVALETRAPVVLTTLDAYQCALGPARRNDVQCFGNALLSRHPILEVHRLDLSMKRREPRGALAATLEIDGQPLHVMSVHLGLHVEERRFQVRQILEYLDSIHHERVIVLGDFNDWLPGQSAAHALDDRLGRSARVNSFPVFFPVVPLDRIWARPATALRKVTAHRSPASRVASDHLPVVGELDWGPSSPVSR